MGKGADYDSKAWVNKIPESHEKAKKMTATAVGGFLSFFLLFALNLLHEMLQGTQYGWDTKILILYKI